MTWEIILRYKEQVERIVAEGQPHLRDRRLCKTGPMHLERLALKLHSNYITSELCRPALKAAPPILETHDNVNNVPHITIKQEGSPFQTFKQFSSQNDNAEIAADLRRCCIINLEKTIKAYLELDQIDFYGLLTARSWIGIQRAISAAFLLGVLEESFRDRRKHELLQALEHFITERTKRENTFFDLETANNPDSPTRTGKAPPGLPGRPSSTNSNNGGLYGQHKGQGPGGALGESPHWAKSMAKSLKALAKLNAALAAPAGNEARPVPHPHAQSISFTAPTTTISAAANPAAQMQGVMYQQQPGEQMPSQAQAQFPGPGTWAPQHMGGGSFTSSANLVGTSQMSGNLSPSTQGLSLGYNNLPVTPESTGSGDWNYGNMNERAAEFVQPALWGVT